MLRLFNTQPDMKAMDFILRSWVNAVDFFIHERSLIFLQFQVIYIAPLKAIVRERLNDWKKRLVSQLGKKMVKNYFSCTT